MEWKYTTYDEVAEVYVHFSNRNYLCVTLKTCNGVTANARHKNILDNIGGSMQPCQTHLSIRSLSPQATSPLCSFLVPRLQCPFGIPSQYHVSSQTYHIHSRTLLHA